MKILNNPVVEHFLHEDLAIEFTLRDEDGNRIMLRYDSLAALRMALILIVEGTAVLEQAQDNPLRAQELLDMYIVREEPFTIDDVLGDE